MISMGRFVHYSLGTKEFKQKLRNLTRSYRMQEPTNTAVPSKTSGFSFSRQTDGIKI